MARISSELIVQPQVCRLDKLDGNTAPTIRDEINLILAEGWMFETVFTKGSNTFALFTRPKQQV